MKTVVLPYALKPLDLAPRPSLLSNYDKLHVGQLKVSRTSVLNIIYVLMPTLKNMIAVIVVFLSKFIGTKNKPSCF